MREAEAGGPYSPESKRRTVGESSIFRTICANSESECAGIAIPLKASVGSFRMLTANTPGRERVYSSILKMAFFRRPMPAKGACASCGKKIAK